MAKRKKVRKNKIMAGGNSNKFPPVKVYPRIISSKELNAIINFEKIGILFNLKGGIE